MNLQEVLYEKSGHIATITLNRPEKLNAITLRLGIEYREAMAEAENDPGVRVIIVTGAGRGFCAGADMGLLSSIGQGGGDGSDMPQSTAQPGQHADTRPDFRGPNNFAPGIHKPIIAAINGAAAGLGLVYALYCDLRFASDTAKFSTAFANRGLIAEYGIAWILPRLVGLHHAMDLILSGRVILADEAKRMGLVGEVYPASELMDRVREYAEKLATFSSPRSLAVMKRQIWDGQMTGLADAIALADKEMALSLQCADFREGVASFLEKRTPAWTGQ